MPRLNKADYRLWHDLPLFTACFREVWIDPSFEGSIPDEESASAWRNLNSFAARCTSAGVVTFDDYALLQLKVALEEEQDTTSPARADCNVLAASEWIFQSGKALFLWGQGDGGYEEDEEEAGALYKGNAGLCLERWNFWKQRFYELGDDDSPLSVEARQTSKSAAEKMKEIEDSSSKKETK
ncbi:hypothetical protein DL95DRAFT_417563 [Leptodontidium sp. 2 PMI_412]|nr:hypothetical protein DL95DRAFT_417563 [Leptodontidium sp. 2 PMI_412]